MISSHARDRADDLHLLDRLLRGSPSQAAEAFDKIARRVRTMVFSLAQDLSTSEIEDVTAEVFEQLTDPLRPKFDPSRASLNTFLRNLTLTGIRRLWSASHPAGSPQDLPAILARNAWNKDFPEQEDPADSFSTVERIENTIDAELVLRAASPEVKEALNLRYLGGLSLDDTAKVLNRSRFALARDIDKFISTFSAAA